MHKTYISLLLALPLSGFGGIDYVTNIDVLSGLNGDVLENVTKSDASALAYVASDSSSSSDASRSIDYNLSLAPGMYDFNLSATIDRFTSLSGNTSSYVDTSINSNNNGDLLTFSNPGGGAFSVTFGLDYSFNPDVSSGSSLGNFVTTNYSAFFYQNESFAASQRFDHIYNTTSGYTTLDVADETFNFTGTSGTLEILNLFVVEAYAFGNGVDPAGVRQTINQGYFNLYVKDIKPGVSFNSATGATYSQVPEPSTYAFLFGVGALAMLALRRRSVLAK